MRALVVANSYDADPGFVGNRLRARGFDLVACHREHPNDWPDLDGVELVLPLGSDWSVYWEHVQPSVVSESNLLVAAHQRGIPILGICFGGQMLAHSLGGSVARAPEPEIGWYSVVSAVPELAGDGPWFQWHADRFTAPAGAEQLGSSPLAEQAFRIGRSLALQFHPEVTTAVVERWCRGGAEELKRHGRHADALVAETLRQVGRSEHAATRLVDWFCESVAGTTST